MKNFVVHSIPGSPFARAALLTLEEKGVPWRLASIERQDVRTVKHYALHPFGRMPVLDHDGFRLYETQAILRYIDRAVPHPSLTPSNIQLAARMDQLMNINDWYLFQGAGAVIGFHRVVGPRLLGLKSDEALIAAALPKAQLAFGEIARLLDDKAYLAADTLTLADLLMAPHVDILSLTPEWDALTAGYDNVIAWLARMNERKSMQATTWEKVAAAAQGAPMQKAS